MPPQEKITIRMCAVCRQLRSRQMLLRLTVDRVKGEVFLNVGSGGKVLNGRSAYLCASDACVEKALKSKQLKGALEGRQTKRSLAGERRGIKWPLEPQLIHTLRLTCTEKAESCHNTRREEGSR